MEKKKQGHVITVRDMVIFKKNIECQSMTAFQIGELFYPDVLSSRRMMRMKWLASIGMFGLIEQLGFYSEGKKPYVYYPKPEGLILIARSTGKSIEEVMEQYEWDGTISLRPPQRILQHCLHGAEVNVQFTKALARHGGVLNQWINNVLLESRHKSLPFEIKRPNGKIETSTFTPDHYCVFTVPSYHDPYRQFIEIDEGDETQDNKIRGKIYAYRSYLSGMYAQHYPESNGKGRVEFITSGGPKRAQNIKAMMEECGGRNKFWVTTLDQIIHADSFTDPIWCMAGNSQPRSLIW